MFTEQELSDMRSAILKLASGAVEVQIGDKRYRKSELSQLRETYDWMLTHQTGSSGIIKSKFTPKNSL